MKEQKIKFKKGELENHKLRFLDLLSRNMGMVYQTCKTSGIPYHMHKKWLETDPVYARNIESIENMAIDFAEATLLSLIKDKNPQATMFYLKTKGAKRGYLDKDDSTKQFAEDSYVESMSKEEKRTIIRKLIAGNVEDVQKENQ